MDAERHVKMRKLFFVWWLLVTWLFLGGCAAQGDGENGRIAYLNWDENGRVQLYATGIDQYQPEQLTDVTGDVHSYAVAPDGSRLVYAVRYENGRSELWQLTLSRRLTQPNILLACEQALCEQPVWAPDSRRLIYEKRELLESGAPSLPVLWWLDTETGETITVLENASPPNQSATFSADGKWLSYASLADESMMVYAFETSRFFQISSQLTAPASWNPTSNQLIISDYSTTLLHGDTGENHQEHTHDAVQSIHLFMADTESTERIQLTEGINVDDGAAVWSPTSAWIAFGRKLMFTNTGRQLWLVRPDGSEAVALTNDGDIHHGRVSWGENGRFLLHQQFNITTPQAKPSIHIIDINTKQQQTIAPTGFQPSWLNQE